MPPEFCLSHSHAGQMLDRILACLPEEACGVVVGTAGCAERVIAVTNELHSPVRFRMAAQEQLDVLLWLEEHGRDLLAIFHSHPTGPAYPSETDIAEFFYPGVVTLIWSAQGGSWQPRAFLIEDRQVTEIPVCWKENG